MPVLLYLLISSLAKTSFYTAFWLNLNYNPCQIKCSSSSSQSRLRIESVDEGHMKIQFGFRAFSDSAPRLWNALRPTIDSERMYFLDSLSALTSETLYVNSQPSAELLHWLIDWHFLPSLDHIQSFKFKFSSKELPYIHDKWVNAMKI